MRLGRGVFVFDEDTHTLRLKSELFDLRVGYANPILRAQDSQRAVQILSYQCQRNKKTTELLGLGCPFIWRRKRDSNPRAFWANGFQDFLTNPTLTQNNRKYQTVENAETPVKYSPRASPFSRWRVALLCHRQRLAEQSA